MSFKKKKMIIRREHIKLIKCYEYDDYTIKQLEGILNISGSRIRLYTYELCEFFNVANSSELIIKIKDNKEWRKKIKKYQKIEENDRQNYILMLFLNSDIINLNKVGIELDVTRRTISQDLLKIKIFLKQFNLTCSSLNSKGIELIGSEESKRRLFQLILFSLFLEKEYLPDIFNPIFNQFNEMINEKIEEKVKKRLNENNVKKHTYIIRKIFIIIYVGLIRNKKLFGFRYELNSIKDLLKKNQKNNLIETYKNDFHKVEKFLNYVNENTEFYLDIPERSYIGLSIRFALIRFKNQFGIKEIYLLNKNFDNNYKIVFNVLMNIIEKYFANSIDSLDKISIFLILKDYLYKKIDKKTKRIIAYDTFQNIILEEIKEELEVKIGKIDDIVSIYYLKSYIKNNNVKNILIFENIELDEYIDNKCKINIIRCAFPLGEVDYIKIQKLLK